LNRHCQKFLLLSQFRQDPDNIRHLAPLRKASDLTLCVFFKQALHMCPVSGHREIPDRITVDSPSGSTPGR
jgi:hypothetical protein